MPVLTVNGTGGKPLVLPSMDFAPVAPAPVVNSDTSGAKAPPGPLVLNSL